MAGSASFGVRIHINEDKASDEFKEARRNINRQLRAGLERAAEKAVMPDARRLAPSFIGPALVVRARPRSAVLTTRLRGKAARTAGLLHWGGTVRTPIRPRKAKAIFWPGADHPVAVVTGPRRIKAKLYLVRAIEQNRRQIDEAVTEEMMRVFDGLDHD